jgi:hypothetical protein
MWSSLLPNIDLILTSNTQARWSKYSSCAEDSRWISGSDDLLVQAPPSSWMVHRVNELGAWCASPQTATAHAGHVEYEWATRILTEISCHLLLLIQACSIPICVSQPSTQMNWFTTVVLARISQQYTTNPGRIPILPCRNLGSKLEYGLGKRTRDALTGPAPKCCTVKNEWTHQSPTYGSASGPSDGYWGGS